MLFMILKNNNDFYKYKTEIYIHDGTYVVFATNVIDSDKNFTAVSIDGKKWEKVEENLPYFREIFWNNGKFNVVTGNDDSRIYSSIDGNEWYSFRYDFVKNYSKLSCFKEYGILFTLQNDNIYLSNNLKDVKKIRKSFWV